MLKFYEKHETLFCISLIIIYIVLNSFCMQNFGLTDYRAVIVNYLLSIIILIFIFKNKLGEKYGLISLPKAKKFLYFIPLGLIVSVNLWNGINIQNTTGEIICFMLSMLAIGFLEEIIFRGFLYKMMEKDSIRSATIVSSITFGIGHIINLLNGAEVIPTLFQICYAIAAGFLFVKIFQKGKSLWPCIIAHGLMNALSIFNIDNNISMYVVPIFLIVVPILYITYLNKNT